MRSLLDLPSASHGTLRCNDPLAWALARRVHGGRRLAPSLKGCPRLQQAPLRRRALHVRRTAVAAVVGAGSPQLRVEFAVPCHVGFGNSLMVVGDVEGLGGWDPAAGVRLEWGEGDIWTGVVQLQAGRINFKVVKVLQGGGLEWEPGNNREVTLLQPSAAVRVLCPYGDASATLVELTAPPAAAAAPEEQEEPAAPTEQPVPAAAEQEMLSAADEEAAPAEEVPAAEQEAPSAAKEEAAPAEEVPVAEQEAPSAAKEEAAPAEEVPAAEQEAPSAAKEEAAPAEEALVAEQEAVASAEEVAVAEQEAVAPAEEETLPVEPATVMAETGAVLAEPPTSDGQPAGEELQVPATAQLGQEQPAEESAQEQQPEVAAEQKVAEAEEVDSSVLAVAAALAGGDAGEEGAAPLLEEAAEEEGEGEGGQQGPAEHPLTAGVQQLVQQQVASAAGDGLGSAGPATAAPAPSAEADAPAAGPGQAASAEGNGVDAAEPVPAASAPSGAAATSAAGPEVAGTKGQEEGALPSGTGTAGQRVPWRAVSSVYESDASSQEDEALAKEQKVGRHMHYVDGAVWPAVADDAAVRPKAPAPAAPAPAAGPAATAPAAPPAPPPPPAPVRPQLPGVKEVDAAADGTLTFVFDEESQVPSAAELAEQQLLSGASLPPEAVAALKRRKTLPPRPATPPPSASASAAAGMHSRGKLLPSQPRAGSMLGGSAGPQRARPVLRPWGGRGGGDAKRPSAAALAAAAPAPNVRKAAGSLARANALFRKSALPGVALALLGLWASDVLGALWAALAPQRRG